MHKKVLFIHHSTGANLLAEGNVRSKLEILDPAIELWDHSYNLVMPNLASFTSRFIPHRTGLSDQNGEITGTDYQLHIANNTPRPFADIFTNGTSMNKALPELQAYDLVIFKNCFPTTKIESDEQLEEFKSYYTTIKKGVSKQSNQWLLMTPPPLREEVTTPEWAARARELSDWTTGMFSKSLPGNLHVFDFFSLLAEDNKNNSRLNTLREKYCKDNYKDSHPNTLANQQITAKFTKKIASILQ